MRILRSILIMSAAVLAAVLSACSTPEESTEAASEGYCYSIRGPIRPTKTCTGTEPPSALVEADAKLFAAKGGLAAVYIVRRSWSDTAYRVPVRIDDGIRFDSIPYSFARATLPPGHHRLVLEWNGDSKALDLELSADDVRFVEIEGAAWSWGPTYEWSTRDPVGARKRAVASKLVADFQPDLH